MLKIIKASIIPDAKNLPHGENTTESVLSANSSPCNLNFYYPQINCHIIIVLSQEPIISNDSILPDANNSSEGENATV